MTAITASEIQFFQDNGYLIKRKFVEVGLIQQLNDLVENHLKQRIEPFELECEVDYPGSPKSKDSEGGETIRRLLLAYQRDELIRQWAEDQNIQSHLKALLDSEELYFVPSHHNCIMTKQPNYSSETHWHKDVRYWGFNRNQLINTWLPLGEEKQNNGCLLVIPKSHNWSPAAECLDGRLFLREDLPETQEWIDQAITVELHQGDLLFFHAALFHAAGKNLTGTSKNALVLTYHGEGTFPLEGSKSTKYPEIEL